MNLTVLLLAGALLTAAPNPAAVAAFQRAERHLAEAKYDEAIAAYREALAQEPAYAAALNGLGSALFRKGQRDEAIAQFKAAIQADPAFKLAYFNLGYAARKASDFATAARAYQRYTELEPADPDGFYGLAESHRLGGDAPKAIAAYEQYVAKEKRPSEQKWVEKAKEQISALRAEAAKPPPATPPKAGTETVARPDAPVTLPPAQPPPSTGATATVTTPSTPPATWTEPAPAPARGATTLSIARVAEGDRLMQDRRYRDAAFAYQDAANADPASVEALFKLGNAYAVLGYYDQAIKRWQRVGELTPDAAIRKSVQENVAKAQAKIAQGGGGSPQAQGARPGEGPIADGTRERARATYETGVAQINARDYAAALQSLTSAIELEPTLAIAFVARGSANIGLRRFGEAVADYDYALRLDPKMASPLYGLAEAYRGLGRTADARTYYERYATSTAPDVRPQLQEQARKKADQLKGSAG